MLIKEIAMLRKIISTLLLLSTLTVAQDITGSGTSGDPYILYNPADLDSLRYYDFNGKYFKLNADMDLSGYANWVPIGSRGTQWRGYLDLNNKTISNLTITSYTTNGMGLFGGMGGNTDNTTTPTFYNGRIKDINISVTGATVGTALLVGGIAGYLGFSQNEEMVISDITIENITIYINSASGTPTSALFGGAIGKNDGCSVELIRVKNAQVYVSTSASVADNAERGMGGLIGGNTGTSTSIVRQSYVDNNSRIECSMSAVGVIFTGGLIGTTFGSGTGNLITNCYSRAKVFSNYYAGGLIGYKGNTSTTGVSYIVNCYVATDSVNSNHVADIDGLIFGLSSNAVGNTVDSTFADTTLSTFDRLLGTNSAGLAGRAVTATFLKDSVNLPSWDFVNIWNVVGNANDGYPYLRGSNVFTILYPMSQDTYFAGDTLQFKWLAITDIPIDTFYISLGDSTWTTVDSSFTITLPTVFDLTGTYYLYLEANNDPTLIDSVDIFFYAIDHIKILYASKDTVITESFGVEDIRIVFAVDTTGTDSLVAFKHITASGQLDTTTITLIWPNGISGNLYVRANRTGLPVLGLTMGRVSVPFAMVYESTVPCYDWKLSGIGAIWARDKTCGWVPSNRNFQTGTSSITFGGYNDIRVSYSINNFAYPDTVAPPYPPCEHPSIGDCDYPDPTVSNKTASAHGRTYTLLSNGKLNMTDHVNNVTYQVIDFSLHTLIGVAASTAGITVMNGWLVIYNNPPAEAVGYATKVFDAPKSTVNSFWEPVTVNKTRDYFRGIIPKAYTTRPPLGDE